MFDEEMHSMLDIALCLGLVEIILGLAYISSRFIVHQGLFYSAIGVSGVNC